MKDSYSFDVDDEGLAASYAAHRDAYIKIFDRLGLRLRHRRRRCPGRWAARPARSSSADGRDRRGHLRPLHRLRLRRQRRGGHHARAPPRGRVRRRAAPRTSRTRPDTPTIETLVDLPNAREPPRRTGPGRRRHAEERAGHARHPDGTAGAARHRRARRPRGRPEAARGGARARRGRAVRRRPTSRRTRPWSRATSARARSASERRPASATWSTPGSSTGTRWVTGADEPGHHVFDLVAGRDFTADGTIEAAEVRDGDPSPDGDRRARDRPRHRDRPHLPARPQVRRGPRPRRCSTRTASSSRSPWAPTGSASPARSPRSPSSSHDELGLVWPREVAPADVHLVATGKDGRRSARRPSSSPRELDAAGLRVLLDDRTGARPA